MTLDSQSLKLCAWRAYYGAALALLGAACSDPPGPLAPAARGPRFTSAPCRVVDDSTTRTRTVMGGCGNTSRIALLPLGWVVVRAAGELVERGKAPNAAAATVAVADSGTTAGFSVISLPDANYVASTTKVPLGESAYITDGTLGISLSAAPDRTPLAYNLVDPDTGFWTTWSSPPYSESPTPWYMEFGDWFDVPVTLNMSLSRPVTTFGFEVEPAPWAVRSFDVSYYAADTVLGTVSMSVDGYGGARLVAIRSARPFDSVSVVSNSDFAIAQVRYAATVQPSLAVACVGSSGAPGPITRGDLVRCTATVTPAAAYTVVRSRATTTDSNLVKIDAPLSVAISAGAPYVWEGPAVTSTAVLIAVDVPQASGGTQHFSYETSYTVAPRIWPVPQLVGPTAEIYGLAPSSPMMAYPSNGVLGGMRPDDPTSMNSAVVTRAAAGPNQGLGFIATPFTQGGYTVWLHPGLDTIPTGTKTRNYTPAQQWHVDQNGHGGGTCNTTVFFTLIPEIERHEGVTKAADSHWGVATRAYQNYDLAAALERVYAGQEMYDPDGTLRDAEYQAWWNFHDGTGSRYSRDQAQFDSTDYPLVNKRLGCTLDYNLNDS